MIVRQRLPMAVKVNVVPSRRRRAGLGDTCTPTNCPNGPYAEAVSNYDYWLQQGTQSGAVAPPAQGTDPSLDTTSISQAITPQAWASYSDLQTALGWELCQGPDVAAQFACSQRNDVRQQKISAIQEQYHGAVPANILSSIVPVPGGPVANPPIVNNGPLNPTPATPPPPSSSPASLKFVTSRGGNTLYPGDTWEITITGAGPHAAVAVVGGQNGAMNNTPTGTTDQAGNFSLSGTIDSSQIGSWYEAWTVGGTGIGTITFTVAATPLQQSGGTQSGGTQSGGTQSGGTQSGGTQSGGTQSGGSQSGGTQTPATSGNWFTDQMISGVPNWALVAAVAAVAVFAFSGGKR